MYKPLKSGYSIETFQGDDENGRAEPGTAGLSYKIVIIGKSVFTFN